MKIRFLIISLAVSVLAIHCTSPSSLTILTKTTSEMPTFQMMTPVSQPKGHLEPRVDSNIARVWANTGEEKITRDELRSTRDPNSVLNSVWNGAEISLFGARNEVVAFNLILEAPAASANQINVAFPSLSGPDDTQITSRSAIGDDVFKFVGRNIELFYVRYLEIKGISTDLFFAGYDYDERHIPERCRRPYQDNGEGSSTWEDRPCHNKLYPDIAVPLELQTPFNIPAGSNQSIWVDITIPKSVTAGNYHGTIAITEGDTLTWEIPVQLQVYDFTLPDLPNARTMVYISRENINNRFLGETEIAPKSATHTQSQQIMDRHFQLAHRHKISLIDSYTPVELIDETWLARLNGELFRPERGYDGIGIGTGNNVYAIGTYGDWPWMDGAQEDMWAHSNQWVEWFEDQNFNTPTGYFLYLIDESDDYKQIESWSRWIDDNPGPGQRLMALATLDLPEASAHTPTLDIPASWARFGIPSAWQNAAVAYSADPDKRFFLYNSNRPATGTFAIEDEGIALRQLAWTQYKMGIDRWFYWESTYYANYQCYGDDPQAQTNVFQQAQTYGCLETFDESLGETGWNYLNGDGVLFYPGTDIQFPEESYDVIGPFASLRLKMWRRGIQDVDYLTMAAEVDPERTTEIVNTLIPSVLWELGVEEIEDPTYLYANISWPIDPDMWEAARAELAEIIQRESP